MPAEWDAEAAEVYLLDLASQHSIEVAWISPDEWQEAMAFEAARMVYIPAPVDFGQFLVGLHEIGHIVGPPAPDEAGEGRAWLWATRVAAMR